MTSVADQLSLESAAGLRVIWDREAAAALAALVAGGDASEPSWQLEGSLEPEFTALRVVTGATAEGALLVLCAARPAGATHHDEDAVSAVFVNSEGDQLEIQDALISTEYGADGAIRRLGLELYPEGEEYPVRGAGDAVEGDSTGERVRLSFRIDGGEGAALHETVRPA